MDKYDLPEQKYDMFYLMNVKVSSDSQFSRALQMNVTTKIAQYNLQKFVQRLGLVKKCIQSIIACNQRQNIVSKCDTQTPKLA